MSSIHLNSEQLPPGDLHEGSEQNEQLLSSFEASNLMEVSLTTPHKTAICLSESIPSDSGTPTITFKKKKTESLHTPINSNMKSHKTSETNENLSPNCNRVCTSTPNAATATSPSANLKSTSSTRSPLIEADARSLLKHIVRDVAANVSEEVNNLPQTSQSDEELSVEVAQVSFATARADSGCPSLETTEYQETSRGSQQPEFTTPSASFELPHCEPLLRSDSQQKVSPEGNCSVMEDVSMMSVDGDVSINVPNQTFSDKIASGRLDLPELRKTPEVNNNDVLDKVDVESGHKTKVKLRVESTGAVEGAENFLHLSPRSERTESRGSTGNVCLNGTFEKSPSKPTDPLSGGDGLDVAFSTLGITPTESKLDRTFNKDELTLASPPTSAEKSTESPKLNNTFSKLPSDDISQTADEFARASLAVPATADYSLLSKSPDLDLRLDITVQPEEGPDHAQNGASPTELNKIQGNEEPEQLHSTPDEPETVKQNQSTPRKARRLSETFSEKSGDSDGIIKNDEILSTSNQQRQSNSGSFLKRRCSLLELSFVSSPKRQNLQLNTPKGIREKARVTMLGAPESIAFDFSAAAATAKKNNGVAEMGSFVFSSTSGQPIAADLFDLSALEKIDTSSKPGAEKYTRVSFVAMFDPIKPDSPTNDKLCRPEQCFNNSSCFFSPMKSGKRHTFSPLVAGLPTPAFARPNISTVECGIQTESVEIEQKTEILEDENEIKILISRVEEMKSTIEYQRQALATYERVVSVLKERLLQPRDTDFEEVTRLKAALMAERERNKQQDEVVNDLERTMQSTLNRISECRESNAAIAEVVQQQRDAMADMRAHCNTLQLLLDEVKGNAATEISDLKAKCEEIERNHKKVAGMQELQLKAKESELDFSRTQLSMAQNEIAKLRELVNEMKIQ